LCWSFPLPRYARSSALGRGSWQIRCQAAGPGAAGVGAAGSDCPASYVLLCACGYAGWSLLAGQFLCHMWRWGAVNAYGLTVGTCAPACRRPLHRRHTRLRMRACLSFCTDSTGSRRLLRRRLLRSCSALFASAPAASARGVWPSRSLPELSHRLALSTASTQPGRVRGARRSRTVRGLSAVFHVLDTQAAAPPGHELSGAGYPQHILLAPWS
jgi:hypothetical protein